MKTLKNYIDSIVNKVLTESLEKKADELIEKIKSNVQETDENENFYEIEIDEDYMEEGETCEQCGGNMNEGECTECGYKMEGLTEDVNPESEQCKYHKEKFGTDDERTIKFCGTEKNEMTEKLHGRQRKLDKNRIDAEDFKMLRKGKKSETDEGNAFTGALAKAKKDGDDEFEVDGKKYQVKESLRLSENEMIDLIEKIVNEEKDNIKKQSNPPGISTTKKNLDKSKKENDDYIKSVTKKMKEYLKDGSKGGFDMEPKMFPKGNGELSKMNKKTYKPTKEVEEYIENFSTAGQENLMFDEIHPNEEWMDSNIEGSSKTGNDPKYANATETDANKKINKKRKDNYLGILKKKESYNRQPQPVYDFKEDDEKEKNVARIFQKLESTEDKKEKILKEEINKMTHLLGYNKKTQ